MRSANVTEIETCCILGVNVSVINMEQTVCQVEQNIENWRGKYICVSNGHTTVTAFEDDDYRRVQNEAVLVLPDGEPLSVVSRMRGFANAKRVTGPDFMEEMFLRAGNGLRHYFYGGKQETIETLKRVLKEKYPDLQIAGMYSPPFRELTPEEDAADVARINASGADIVWVGLGAPKQERWMNRHQGKVQAVMIGVGAGFDYHAGEIKRAPKWAQRIGMEWFFRLLQDPKRLWKRYLVTNVKFIVNVIKENRKLRKRK